MPNKIKYNLKNTHYAPVISGGFDEKYVYAAPRPIPGAVSLSLSPEGKERTFDADGVVAYRIETDAGYSGTIEFAMIPDDFRIEILKEIANSQGVIFEDADRATTDSTRFALLFEFDGDSKGIRHVLYNCCASRPQIASKTRTKGISPETERLDIKAEPRLSDYYVKAKTSESTGSAVYNAWYNAVYSGRFNILDYLVYEINYEANTIGITDVNEAKIVSDNLRDLIIPDTIDGFAVKLSW